MKYNTKDIIDEITLDEILKRTTEYDIYKFYLCQNFKIGKPISSPFREDKHPSFGIFYGARNGDLIWKDHGTGQSGNIVQFVQEIFNETSNTSLKRIWQDLIEGRITEYSGIRPIERSSKSSGVSIGIRRKNYTIIDRQYWGEYGLSIKLLKYFNVYPISRFWINNVPSHLVYKEDSPMYVYKVFNNFKIYRPLEVNKKNKWRNNLSKNDIQGYEQLPPKGSLLVITKSLKDIMVLRTFGYYSIAPSTETTTISDKIISELMKHFKKIIVLYDNDQTGKIGAQKLHDKYNFEMVFIPDSYREIYNVKDVSDFRKIFGSNKTKELLKELIKR